MIHVVTALRLPRFLDRLAARPKAVPDKKMQGRVRAGRVEQRGRRKKRTLGDFRVVGDKQTLDALIKKSR